MKKSLLLISVMVLVLVLALFAFTACNNAESEIGEELVQNGDFSLFEDSKFTGWTWNASSSSDKYGQFTTETATSLHISNSSTSSTSYLKQTIAVDTNEIYKVVVQTKINTALSNKSDGAYVMFEENVDYKFAGRKDTTDGFVTTTFYVRPKNVDTLTLSLTLNGSGDVYFDKVSMQRVDKADVPAGAEIVDFKKSKKTVNSNVDVNGVVFAVMLTAFSVAVIVCAYVLIRRIYGSRHALADFGVVGDGVSAKAVSNVKWYQNSWFICAMLMVGTLLVRLVFILSMYGMGKDMTDLLTLSRSVLASKNGVFNFMAKYPTSQYGPGELYIMAIVGAMTQSASINVSSIVLRLINALADTATVAMIFFYGKKRVGNKLATVYAGLYALLPLTFFMGGLNSGFESVLVALMVASVILMVEKKYLSTYFVMTLATVLDIRALAIAPIIIAYFVYMYIRDDANLKKFTSNRAKIVFGLVATIPFAYLLTLPVGINQIAKGDAFFNFKVLVGEYTNVNYYTYNAFNLYGMVAMNGKGAIQGVKILNLVFLLVLEAYAVSLYFRNRNRQELILLASFVLAAVAVFSIKVNYTYLFLAIALGLIYTMVSGDRRMYGVMGALATLGFLCIAQLMGQSGHVVANATKAIVSYQTKSVFYILFSVVTVLVMGYYAYVCYSITNNSKIVDIPAMPYSFGQTVKDGLKSLKARFSRNDD